MKRKNIIKFFIPAVIVGVIILGIIIFPKESIDAAKNGFFMWSNVLIPSLLPFIIGANLIVNLKFIDVLGLIINPIARKLFNVSGKACIVFAISTVSGYPVGAKLASELRQNNEISKSEAQRLVSFCSTSGPLFIIGAVAIGMFNNDKIGYLMILCHYLGSLTVGLLFRNYGKESIVHKELDFKYEINRIVKSRFENSKGFFALLGDSVNNGVNTILMVGGFVIIFSVVFRVLSLFNIIGLVSSVLYIPLSFLGISKPIIEAFISGLFEITIGCNAIAQITSSPEILRVSLASFLIAFSGLSILAQCANFLAKTDINLFVYSCSKFLHGIFAFLFTMILYPFINNISVPTFNLYNVVYTNPMWITYINNYKIILPILIILYIFSSVSILRRYKSR